MATSFIFDNNKISTPGAYSTIKSGIKNPALDLGFGSALIIDTGSGATWGGGAGIAGELASGEDAIYTFDNVSDFSKFVGGGLWWYASKPMFFPGGGASKGVSSLTIIRASATLAATMSWTFAGGGANGGVVSIKAKHEGVAGNGILGDETRATSKITVSSSGATADTIDIVLDGVTVASFENQASDSVAQAVAALVASAKSLDLVQVVASDATSLTITQVAGKGADTTTPTVNVTGTAAAAGVAFSGGLNGTKVTRGFASKLRVGKKDPTKFAIDFYRGTYRGRDSQVALDTYSDFEGVAEADTTPELLVSSVEFDNVATLGAWMTTDATFNGYFQLVSSAPAGSGLVDTTDATTYSGNNLATGGTETYSSGNIDTALSFLVDKQFDFIICDKWGDSAQHANNLKIQAWVTTQAKTKSDIYIGGGNDALKWTQALGSIPTAEFYNDEKVTVVHSGCWIPDVTKATGFRKYASVIHAAYVLGREAGLAPQVPITFKSIGIAGLQHNLTPAQVDQGLEAGVVMTKKAGTTYDIQKGVNTLQNNSFLVNPDGSTSSKQIRRIVRQLNKELVTNATNQLLKNPDGTNRNTLSAIDVKTWIEGYLKNKVATDTQDDLILSFGNISVAVVGDAYNVTYEIVPNFEVSFIFMTGFLLDPTS